MKTRASLKKRVVFSLSTRKTPNINSVRDNWGWGSEFPYDVFIKF